MPFRKVDETEVWRGAVVWAAVAHFEAPTGEIFEREVIHHPGAVSAVPLLDDGATVVLVRQYRASIDRELLEIPAGKRDVQGEPTEETARRELIEEVGLEPGHLEHLVTFFHSPGYCDEEQTVYLATDLRPAATDQQGIEEEHMTIEHVALADVPALIAAGELTDSKTIIALLLLRDRLRG